VCVVRKTKKAHKQKKKETINLINQTKIDAETQKQQQPPENIKATINRRKTKTATINLGVIRGQCKNKK